MYAYYNAKTGFHVCPVCDVDEMVGGNSTTLNSLFLEKHDITMWYNELGKTRDDYEPTLALECNGEIADIISGGNIVFTGNDGGLPTDLTDEQISLLFDHLQDKQLISRRNPPFIGYLSAVVVC